MKYAVNRSRRNIIILCSSFLILYILTSRVFFLLKAPAAIDALQALIDKICFLIPYVCIMLGLIAFFRHYKLKAMQISVFIIMVTEVLLRASLFSDIFDSTITKALFITTIAIWMTTSIIWIILLFQLKTEDEPGIRSIRRYAISTVLFFILTTTIPLFVAAESRLATQTLTDLTTAIPFIFSIDFALKLKISPSQFLKNNSYSS